MKITYNNINMRLTPITIVSAITAVLLVGLLLLLASNPSSAFQLSDEGENHHSSGVNAKTNSKYDSRSNEINQSDNPRGSESSSSSSSLSFVLPKSSLSSTSLSSSSGGGVSNVISKRSLSSSSSSSSSSDPTSFRSHRHENSIVKVAWPGNPMWGFLPMKKKPGGGVEQPPPPSTLHSQSATSSFSKKSTSSISQSGDIPGKKKSASSSDLSLDPVTLDDIPSHYFRRGEATLVNGGGSGRSSPSNSFFHNSASSIASSKLGGTAEQPSPTPPPRPHYMRLEPPTRIEPPLGNDDMDNEVLDDLDATREFPLMEHHQDPEHSSWLKRSSNSAVVINRASSMDINKRTRNYDVPQIECPPAEDGMERFACPSTDRFGRYRCVDDHVLCDGFIDCPGKEDEDLQACMFYKTTKAHLDVLADALLRWARGKR